jgi:hypothetical protein
MIAYIQGVCNSNFIAINGDYSRTNGCICNSACEETVFNAHLSSSRWPMGTFSVVS